MSQNCCTFRKRFSFVKESSYSSECIVYAATSHKQGQFTMVRLSYKAIDRNQ